MTDDLQPASATDLPISAALRATIESERLRVANNPLGSQTRSLSQNIDALFAIVGATVAAVESLETQLRARAS